jgi:hypothetical protein
MDDRYDFERTSKMSLQGAPDLIECHSPTIFPAPQSLCVTAMPTLTGCSVCLKCTLAIAKRFSRGSTSIAIASEFFGVSVMVVFMARAACTNIHRVAKDFDLGSGCTILV